MESKNMIGTIVTLAVVVICVATIMMPVISDAVEDNITTYTNEGTGYHYTIDPDEDQIVITASALTDWTLNGETYNVTGVDTILSTDVCRVHRNSNFLQLYDSTGARTSNIYLPSYLITLTYDKSEGTFTWVQYSDTTDTTVAATYSYDVSHVMIYDPDGDYVSLTSDGDTAPGDYYINSLDQVIAGGAYTSGELDTSYFAQGETVTVGVSDYTASATATTTEVVGDKIIMGSTYTVTVTDGTTTETFTPYTIYVPNEVTCYTDSQIAQNALYSAIPVLVIVSIVVASIGLVVIRRD